MFRGLPVFVFIATIAGAAHAQTNAPQKAEEPRAPQIFSQTMSSGDGSYLGVQMKEVTKENFAALGLREVRGAAIEKVLGESPADRAGLQPNDVIVKFNGTEVSSARQLTRLVAEVAPDHQARITILRGGSEREITATMGKRDTAQFEQAVTLKDFYGFPGIPEFPEIPKLPAPPGGTFGSDETFTLINGQSRQIGVAVAPLTEQLADYFGVSGKGLLINNVRPDSPAAKAGLKAGDVIVEVEGKSVASNLELIRALGEKKEGDVGLMIVRDKNRRVVRVTPEVVKSGNFNFAPEFPKFDGFN
jgi:serine protease Do